MVLFQNTERGKPFTFSYSCKFSKVRFSPSHDTVSLPCSSKSVYLAPFLAVYSSADRVVSTTQALV